MRARVLGGVVAAAIVVGAAATSAGATTPVHLSVSVTASRHAISPLIYGVNYAADATGLVQAFQVPVNRWGGNSTSRYNYLTDTYNTGSDWYFENILANPGERLTDFVSKNKSHHIASLVTLPMTGWVSKQGRADHPFDCSYPRTTFPNQSDFDTYDTNCGNGHDPGGASGPNLTADPTTTSVAAGPAWDAAEVTWLVKKYGAANKGGVSIYELDNEPVLWNSTHHDVHPNPLTYDELKAKSIAAAKAVKTADATAKVLGPSDWGWCAYYTSAADNCDPSGSDHQAHGLDLAPWYLQQFKAASTAAHTRLLDYFDEHFYPQANGVFGNDVSAGVRVLRLASTRSLWDPTFTDPSWISQTAHPKLAFIRTMKKWVATYYPGTKTAITEYNFGALDNINGALAEADVLGIFGREGLDLATLWAAPTGSQPGAFAFKMYLNYDGKGAHFGDVSVKSASSDQGRLAVYAAQRTKDQALTLMVINKTDSVISAPVSIAGFATASTGRGYRYSAANVHKIVNVSGVKVASGRVSLGYPANSITLLVLPKK